MNGVVGLLHEDVTADRVNAEQSLVRVDARAIEHDGHEVIAVDGGRRFKDRFDVAGHVFVQESHDFHTGTNGMSRSVADSRKVLPAEEIALAIGALIARR